MNTDIGRSIQSLALVVALFAPLRPDDAFAQAPGAPKRWEPISNPGFDPPIAGAQNLVLDSARNRAYVYTRAALWSLDLSAGTWSSFALTNHPPVVGVAQIWATERMVLDPVTSRLLVMWGPEDWSDGIHPGETWALDLTAPTAWTQVASSGPWNRTPVVIDVANRRILSSSGHYDGFSTSGTRVYRLTAPIGWSTVFPSPSPYPRSGSFACFDATRSRVWMWGWSNDTNPSIDPTYDETAGTLWAYQHGAGALSWKKIPTTAPAGAPTKGLISHDPVRDRLLYVDAFAGVWALQIAPDGLSGAWSHTTSAAEELPSGLPSAQVYDPVGDRLLALVGTRVWSLRLFLPEPPPEAVARDEMFVRPRGGAGFAVRLVLAQATDARLDVFDVRGRRVTGVDAGRLSAGASELDIPLSGVPAGVYFVRATLDGAKLAVRRAVHAP